MRGWVKIVDLKKHGYLLGLYLVQYTYPIVLIMRSGVKVYVQKYEVESKSSFLTDTFSTKNVLFLKVLYSESHTVQCFYNVLTPSKE